MTNETGTAPLGLGVTAQWIGATASVGTPRRYWFYSPELQLLSETSLSEGATPPIEYDYVWFGGEPAAQVNNTTGEVAYYFNDHLGAPLLQTDATGTVVWRVERDPYGERYATRVGGGRHQPLGLPGQEYDASSDRQYNIFRWYRAGWGRYTQVDPISFAGGDVNLYRYALANPLLFIDPTGLQLYHFGSPPNTPLPGSHCQGGPWNHRGRFLKTLRERGLWQLTSEKPLMTAGAPGKNSVGSQAVQGNVPPARPGRNTLQSGWCLCTYQIAGLTTYYGASDMWERQVNCCSDSYTERASTRQRFWSQTSTAIGSATRTTFAPYDHINRTCACLPALEF